MQRGEALDDADREPWLRAVRRRIDDCLAEGRDAVVACSALKGSYRETLLGQNAPVFVVSSRGYTFDTPRLQQQPL